MCQRQSITTECIFGEEEEDSVLDDSPSPLVPQIVPPLVPVPKEGLVKNKRAKLERKQSVMQYMKDQQSIDDDPVANLYTVIILNIWPQKATIFDILRSRGVFFFI